MKNADNCMLCPRKCNIDRTKKIGLCGMPKDIYCARAALHFWEEPCISGERGSGTVFFTGCPLKCIYCQNIDIAKGSIGKRISVNRLAEIFIELQNKGAHNINLVTPTHYSDAIIKAVNIAREKGLDIPIVYNTSGYENVKALKALEGIVDIYLTDIKYMDSSLALKYSNAKNYPDIAKAALDEMMRQTGSPVFDSHGIMKRGVIVRHLLLPNCLENGKAVVKYVYEKYGDLLYISLMNQYTPIKHFEKFPELNNKVGKEEYDALVDYALSIGVENGFIQEGDTAEESFIPPFDCEGV